MDPDAEAVTGYATRAGHFATAVRRLDSVNRVEKVSRDGVHYWKVYPTEPVIPADLAEQLGRHGLNATPDADGLLVDAGGAVFEGEDVELIQEAVRSVMEMQDADPLELSQQAAAIVDSDAEVTEDIDSVTDALAEMGDLRDLVELVFFDDDGDPRIDPDDETVEWVVLPWPHEGIGAGGRE